MYLLIKVHKDNFPGRPVVSQIGDPTYHMCKILTKILNPLDENGRSFVSNAVQLKKFLKEVEITPRSRLASFDVKALYPSIPVLKALEIVKEELEKDATLKDRTSWTPKEIIDLLQICLETHFKTLDGRVFTQINGTPIGKSISGPIAGIYMNWFEEQFIESDQCQMKPKFWKRMRDDVLIVWDHGEEKLEEMLGYLNEHEERIQFTIEKEIDRVLPFLDLSIRREDHSLITKVYRKGTHTFRYLHWRSNHSEKCLLGVMKGLIFRAHKLCDLEEDLKTELGFLKDMFISNGYPVKKVDRVFETYQPNLDGDRDEPEEEAFPSISIPYIRGFSENFARNMRKEGIKVVFSKGQTLADHLCKLKPLKGRLEKKDVVYMVDCKVCGISYIGETSQHFQDRAAQHKNCIKRKDKKNGFAMHVKQTLGRKHKSKGINCMDWDSAVFLDSDNHWKKRKIKESLYINAYDASNKLKGLMNLEKGCKIDQCWNQFNDVIRGSAEKRRLAQRKASGRSTVLRPRLRRSLRIFNRSTTTTNKKIEIFVCIYIVVDGMTCR